MLPHLCDYLLRNWTRLPLGSPRPGRLNFVVQATGVSKVCCYLFMDDAAQPRWVAKMARSPHDNGLLAREYRLIQDLRTRASGYVRETVPGPLFITSMAHHLVGIETYLPGKSMDGILADDTNVTEIKIRRCLDLAIHWLLRSQQETASQYGPLSQQQLRTHFFTPIVQLRKVARLTTAEQTYLEGLLERLAALTDYPLPLRFLHGDFQPANILVTDASLHVIDWEFGSLTGLPLMDVFSFLARAYARCRGLEEIDGELEDYIASFEAVFFEGGSFAGFTSEYVTRVCQALRIRPAWLRVLFPLFLVLEAAKYHTFLSHRADRGYVYLLRGNHGDNTSYINQLARQKNVWLLAHLMQHEGRSIFSHLD
jgi:hypothetical protein